MEAFYTVLAQQETTRTKSLCTEIEVCISILFDEITKIDITSLNIPKNSNRVVIWEQVNCYRGPSKDFTVRFLLKGPDRGLVRGFFWMTKKNIQPLLSRLREYYSPFEVYFKHTQTQGIQIVLTWP
jgi:hypothetical protein